MLGISRVAEQLTASQEGFRSTELVSYLDVSCISHPSSSILQS
jgi:hypothetical protein